MNALKYYLFFLVLGFLGSCSTLQVSLEKIMHPQKELVAEVPTDEDLFLLGTSYLGGSSGLTPDYFNAKAAFQRLLEQYPESKWQNLAQIFINLIEEIESIKKESIQRDKNQ